MRGLRSERWDALPTGRLAAADNASTEAQGVSATDRPSLRPLPHSHRLPPIIGTLDTLRMAGTLSIALLLGGIAAALVAGAALKSVLAVAAGLSLVTLCAFCAWGAGRSRVMRVELHGRLQTDEDDEAEKGSLLPQRSPEPSTAIDGAKSSAAKGASGAR